MNIKRLISMFLVVVAVVCGHAKLADAKSMPFADYVYYNARFGRVSTIQGYMRKGYNIDAVNSNGMTALCQAVANRDFRAYHRLKQLGASSNVSCMSRVDIARMQNAQVRYVNSVKASSAAPQSASQVSSLNDSVVYAGAGVLVVGGVAAALALNHKGSSHHSSPQKTCPTGKHLVDGECEDIICPDGQHLDGNTCVPDDPGHDCPPGQHMIDGKCVDIECPEGQHLEDDVCVPDEEPSHDCPVGQRYEDGECKDIVCPDNTHLVGNLCVADDIDVDNNNDDDVYGINSDKEAIFNLYSSPNYPDDSSSINIENKGNGNVYGMYGYSGETEVFNAYMIGKLNGQVNPKGTGEANISIKDNGSGNVYGMYSHIADITQYKEAINASAWHEGVAYANIDIEHIGGGATYGILGDVRAYNVFVVDNGRGYGNINITGDGDIYGIFGYVAATNVVDYAGGGYGEGNINLVSTGNGDVYGMAISKDDIPGAGASGEKIASWFAFNSIGYWYGGGDMRGTISIRNYGDGSSYGMYGGQQLFNAVSNTDGQAYGLIDIVNLGNGNSYGIYMPEDDEQGIVSNAGNEKTHSTVNIVNIGRGTATGLRGGKNSLVDNSGEILINNVGIGTAIGIYGEQNSRIDNSGLIRIYKEQFVDTKDSVVYNPIYTSSSGGGTAYGIYAESGASVINSGEINISGADDGRGVHLEPGATLVNSGTIIFNGEEQDKNVGVDNSSAVSLNDFGGGEILLGQGGQFFASQLRGNMGVAQSVVTGSFENTYTINNALKSDDVSELNMVSKSAMFNAKTEKNSSGNYDVVLERNNFDALVDDASVAQFLEQNYKEGNNLALYDNLKTAATPQALNSNAAKYTGNDVLPSFRRENALLYNQFSRQFNDSLFNRPNEHYLGGYKYIDVSQDRDGNLEGSDGTAHAAYGMVKGKADNGVTYGVGVTVSQLESDYDNHSKRKSNIFGLWAPVGYDLNKDTQWLSKFYVGYEDGEYDRVTPTNKFSSDINSYQYGMTNEVRHNITLGSGFKFTPAAELNLLGIYQKGFDEGADNDAIHADNSNSLSLEGGLGAYLSKDFLFNQDNKLGIQIGGIYYVEFLDPDDGIDAHIQGMSGKYKISHKFDRDRAVFSARVNYDYRNLTLYGLIEQEVSKAKGFVINAGLQYNL